LPRLLFTKRKHPPPTSQHVQPSQGRATATAGQSVPPMRAIKPGGRKKKAAISEITDRQFVDQPPVALLPARRGDQMHAGRIFHPVWKEKKCSSAAFFLLPLGEFPQTFRAPTRTRPPTRRPKKARATIFTTLSPANAAYASPSPVPLAHAGRRPSHIRRFRSPPRPKDADGARRSRRGRLVLTVGEGDHQPPEGRRP